MSSAAIFDFSSGEQMGQKEILLHGVKSSKDIRYDIMHSVILWQLAKRRSGTSCTKKKSDLGRTTAKPHRQKGTGKARQGSSYSAQFRGGGIVFGPKPRDYGYNINKKVRKLALRHAIGHQVMNEQFFIMDNVDKYDKIALSNIRSLIGRDSGLLFIINDLIGDFAKYVRNINGFNLLHINGLNVYDLLSYEGVVVDVDCLGILESKIGDG